MGRVIESIREKKLAEQRANQEQQHKRRQAERTADRHAIANGEKEARLRTGIKPRWVRLAERQGYRIDEW